MSLKDRSHRLARLPPVGLAAAALAAPTAVARPIDDPRLPLFRDGGTTVAVEREPAPARR
jgi:hypothetical protein